VGTHGVVKQHVTERKTGKRVSEGHEMGLVDNKQNIFDGNGKKTVNVGCRGDRSTAKWRNLASKGTKTNLFHGKEL